MSTEKPATLAEALAEVQAHLPDIRKGETAEVTMKTGGKYKYRYADLADVSAVILPMLGAVGLSWITRPTVNESGKFVLAYELLHTCGESKTGEYPLSGGTAQEIGSAITYARRYALCAVTGVAPASDDDDGAAATQRPAERDAWEAAKPARPDHDHELKLATAAIQRAVNGAQLTAIFGIAQQRFNEGIFTKADVETLLESIDKKRAQLDQPADDRCERCRSGEPCQVCEGKACGACPDCSPQVPEWTAS